MGKSNTTDKKIIDKIIGCLKGQPILKAETLLFQAKEKIKSSIKV